MSRKCIALLCIFTAVCCVCATGFADDYAATSDKEHAYSSSSSTSLSYANISKNGGPSGSVGDEYEYQGVNSAAFLSNNVFVYFDDVTVYSNARYGQGIFLLGSETGSSTTSATITRTDVKTYADHSDGIYNSNGSLIVINSQIGTGKIGAASYSPAITTYGKAGSTQLTGVSAWTSGDNSPVLKVYGTGSNSGYSCHLTVNKPSTAGYVNNFYSYGQDSPVLYTTGKVNIYNSEMSADCSAGIVIDGDGNVELFRTSMDLGHTYAPTAKVTDHPAILIGSSISGDASFYMNKGHITTDKGDIFHVTGTKASISLSEVQITNPDANANLLNAGSGNNTNSTVDFRVNNQNIAGNITADSGSTINVTLNADCVFAGSVNKGNHTSGTVNITILQGYSSTPPAVWYLTASSYVSSLSNKGIIVAGPYKLYVNNMLYTSAMAESNGGTFYSDQEAIGNSDAITIKTTALPSGKTDTQYSVSLEAESESSVSWDIVDGSLPEGLSFDEATATISGTPESAGTYIFMVEAYNDSYITARQYTLVITDGASSSVKITTTKLNDASTYSPYSVALAASGTGTVVWSIENGYSLPSGLTLEKTTGVISGTPKKIGTYTFMVRASVDSSSYDTKLLTIKVVEGSDTFLITTDKLKEATVNKNYTVTLKAKGSGTLTWTLSGDLPDGLSFDESKGKISGKPTTAGTYNRSFTVTNGTESATSTFAIIVKDVKPKIKANIKAGMIDTDYTATFSASAGTGDITWTFSGDLPKGLSFNKEELTISGKPTEGWKGDIVITASNSGGSTSKKCKLQIKAIKPKFVFKDIPAATFEEPYSTEAELTGSQPITLTVKGLPEGLSYDYSSSDEVVKIYGTPTKGGKFSVKLTASNIQGKASKGGKIVVNFPPQINAVSLDEAYTEKSYTVKFTAEGTKKITWSVASGDLPKGLTLKATTGQLKGKSTEAGTFSFYVVATNPYGSDAKSFDLVVKVYPPLISTKTIKKGKYQKAYSVKLKTKNGTPDTWSISGDLPAGITFKDGVFSGTPTETFKGSVFVTASNAGGSDSKTYTLEIAGEAPKIKTPSLPSGTVGKEYSASLEATGSPTITWSWSDAPAGLTLDADTGKISGTPTKSGTFKATVSAKNDTKTVNKKYTIKIEGNASGESAQNVGESPEVSELEDDSAFTEQGVGAEYYALTSELPEGFVIAAELPEVSVDVSGMYEFDAALSKTAPIGAKMYWAANSESPSDDDAIAEFFSMDGQEIDCVPENRKVNVSAWLNAGVIYRPVIAVKQ